MSLLNQLRRRDPAGDRLDSAIRTGESSGVPELDTLAELAAELRMAAGAAPPSPRQRALRASVLAGASREARRAPAARRAFLPALLVGGILLIGASAVAATPALRESVPAAVRNFVGDVWELLDGGDRSDVTSPDSPSRPTSAPAAPPVAPDRGATAPDSAGEPGPGSGRPKSPPSVVELPPPAESRELPPPAESRDLPRPAQAPDRPAPPPPPLTPPVPPAPPAFQQDGVWRP